jgi:hypothetical protein
MSCYRNGIIQRNQNYRLFNPRSLVALAVSNDGRIYITQTDANWNWNSRWTEVPGNGRTSTAPAVAVFNNRLVVLIKGFGSDGAASGYDNRIYITQTDANWSWNSRWTDVPGNGRTSSAPAVAVFNGRLVVLVRGQGSDNHIYITQTTTDWQWNSGYTEVPGNGNSWDSPSATVFNGRLVVLATRVDGYVYITQTTANWNWNSEWTRLPGANLDSGSTVSAPAAAVFNGRLVVLGKGAGGRIYITQTTPNWSWNSNWTEVPGNGRSFTRPAVTVFNNRLVILARPYGKDVPINITQTTADWNWNSQWSPVPSSGLN